MEAIHAETRYSGKWSVSDSARFERLGNEQLLSSSEDGQASAHSRTYFNSFFKMRAALSGTNLFKVS